MGHCLIQKISVEKTSVLLPDMLDLFFPIGKIYISEYKYLTPSDLFGGDWEQINGYYLKTCNGNGGEAGGSIFTDPAVGNTGENTNNIYAGHGHYVLRYYTSATNTSSSGGYRISSDAKKTAYSSYTGGSGKHTHTLGGHTHDIKINRTGYYIWKRIA